MQQRFWSTIWRFFSLILLSIGIISCGSNPSDGQKLSPSPVNFATISQDGKYILNITEANAANLWNLETRELVYEWHNNNKPSKLTLTAISPDAGYAATVEPHNIALWNIQTGKTIAYWEIADPIQAAVVGDAGHYALLGLNNGKIYYVDMFTGKSVRTFRQEHAIQAVDLSSDSRYAISASQNKATLWNIQTGEHVQDFEHNANITLVALSNNNEYAMTYSSDGVLNIWRIPSGTLLRRISTDQSPIVTATFAQDDRILALATEQREILLWNVEHGDLIDRWKLGKSLTSAAIRAIAFTNQDARLISEDAAGMLYHKDLNLPN